MERRSAVTGGNPWPPGESPNRHTEWEQPGEESVPYDVIPMNRSSSAVTKLSRGRLGSGQVGGGLSRAMLLVVMASWLYICDGGHFKYVQFIHRMSIVLQ